MGAGSEVGWSCSISHTSKNSILFEATAVLSKVPTWGWQADMLMVSLASTAKRNFKCPSSAPLHLLQAQLLGHSATQLAVCAQYLLGV
jgi:hypothetical protein